MRTLMFNLAPVVVALVVLYVRVTVATWCVARRDASPEALQRALVQACGAGADCTPIQQSGLCYLPNTIQQHASYAFNSYYMRNSMAPHSCDFSGAATLTETNPSYGSCVYPTSPRSMSDNKMQTPNTYPTEEDVAVALAKYIADLSDKFIKQNGYFSVALSGGTLIDTMRKLVEPPYKSSVDWSKWLIFFLDERVVRLDSPDSNYKLVLDGLLTKVPIPKTNVYAIDDTLSAEAAADNYENRLKKLVANKQLKTSSKTGFAKFDLMLLGMGPEGHVASLFCWHFQRFEKKRWVTFIKDSPKPPSERITFTFPLINSASEIAMVVTGEDLADAVKVALGKHSNDYYPLPVQKVSPEGTLTWFLDKDAAKLLN